MRDRFSRCLQAYRNAQSRDPGSFADTVFVARILAVIDAASTVPPPDLTAGDRVTWGSGAVNYEVLRVERDMALVLEIDAPLDGARLAKMEIKELRKLDAPSPELERVKEGV